VKVYDLQIIHLLSYLLCGLLSSAAYLQYQVGTTTELVKYIINRAGTD